MLKPGALSTEFYPKFSTQNRGLSQHENVYYQMCNVSRHGIPAKLYKYKFLYRLDAITNVTAGVHIRILGKENREDLECTVLMNQLTVRPVDEKRSDAEEEGGTLRCRKHGIDNRKSNNGPGVLILQLLYGHHDSHNREGGCIQEDAHGQHSLISVFGHGMVKQTENQRYAASHDPVFL